MSENEQQTKDASSNTLIHLIAEAIDMPQSVCYCDDAACSACVNAAASALSALEAAGYRVVKQEQVGTWCTKFHRWWMQGPNAPKEECDVSIWRDLP